MPVRTVKWRQCEADLHAAIQSAMADRGLPRDEAEAHARAALLVIEQRMAGTRVYVPRVSAAQRRQRETDRQRRDARARALRAEGYSVAQIAARFGESIDTVLRRLKRAERGAAGGAEAPSGSPSGDKQST